MKRICVYLIHDREGAVGGYIGCFLDKLRPFLDRLIVVVNGALLPEGRAELEGFASAEDIVVRDNIGYDVAGFLAGMEHAV